jgi:protein gp37
MSAIEWTDLTWNPVVGCSKTAQGACDHCYAIPTAAMVLRCHGPEKAPQYATVLSADRKDWSGTISRAPAHIFSKPIMRDKPTTYFVNSMSDLFHENMPDEWLAAIFSIMNKAAHHNFQVLTKRPARAVKATERLGLNWTDNIWFGSSIGENKYAKPFVRELLKVPANVRFVSAEPLLEALPDLDVSAIDWLIAGGESGRGPNIRATHPDWLRGLRDRCAAAGTPFFFKQWGEHTESGQRVGKAQAGHLLDGRGIFEMPASVFDRMPNPSAKWTRLSRSTLDRARSGAAALRPYDRELLSDGKWLLVDLIDETTELPMAGIVNTTDDDVDELVHRLGASHPDRASYPNPNDYHTHHIGLTEAALSDDGKTAATIADEIGVPVVEALRWCRRLVVTGKAVVVDEDPMTFAKPVDRQRLALLETELAALRAKLGEEA